MVQGVPVRLGTAASGPQHAEHHPTVQLGVQQGPEGTGEACPGVFASDNGVARLATAWFGAALALVSLLAVAVCYRYLSWQSCLGATAGAIYRPRWRRCPQPLPATETAHAVRVAIAPHGTCRARRGCGIASAVRQCAGRDRPTLPGGAVCLRRHRSRHAVSTAPAWCSWSSASWALRCRAPRSSSTTPPPACRGPAPAGRPGVFRADLRRSARLDHARRHLHRRWLQINAPTEGQVVSIQPVFSGFWGAHLRGRRPRARPDETNITPESCTRKGHGMSNPTAIIHCFPDAARRRHAGRAGCRGAVSGLGRLPVHDRRRQSATHGERQRRRLRRHWRPGGGPAGAHHRPVVQNAIPAFSPEQEPPHDAPDITKSQPT